MYSYDMNAAGFQGRRVEYVNTGQPGQGLAAGQQPAQLGLGMSYGQAAGPYYAAAPHPSEPPPPHGYVMQPMAQIQPAFGYQQGPFLASPWLPQQDQILGSHVPPQMHYPQHYPQHPYAQVPPQMQAPTMQLPQQLQLPAQVPAQVQEQSPAAQRPFYVFTRGSPPPDSELPQGFVAQRGYIMQPVGSLGQEDQLQVYADYAPQRDGYAARTKGPIRPPLKAKRSSNPLRRTRSTRDEADLAEAGEGAGLAGEGRERGPSGVGTGSAPKGEGRRDGQETSSSIRDAPAGRESGDAESDEASADAREFESYEEPRDPVCRALDYKSFNLALILTSHMAHTLLPQPHKLTNNGHVIVYLIDTDNKEWPVMYHTVSSRHSYVFRGGWKAFAEAHGLCRGDSVILSRKERDTGRLRLNIDFIRKKPEAVQKAAAAAAASTGQELADTGEPRAQGRNLAPLVVETGGSESVPDAGPATV